MRHRLALRRHALAVLDRVAGLLQQRARLAQQRAVLAGAVGHRRHERLAEHLVGNLAAERLEQRKLVRPGLPFAIMSEFWNNEWVRS